MIIVEPGEDTTSPNESSHDAITFTIADADGIQYPHHDLFIVILNIDDCNVHHVLIDTGSSVDVLFYDTFIRMKIILLWLKKVETLLIRFERKSVPVEGIITLPVIAGTAPQYSWVFLTFTIIKVPSTYNVIIGRSGLSTLRTIESIPYLKIKFHMPYGIGQLCGDQTVTKQYYLVACQTG